MIELKHFRKQFREKVILNDIQVSFEEAKIVGIVGESGAGKTTLLNLISLLDQDFEGERIISSIDTRHLSKKKREKLRLDTFSYVFSDANLLTYLSVRENILLPLQLQKKAIDEVRNKALTEGVSKKLPDTGKIVELGNIAVDSYNFGGKLVDYYNKRK
jgi:putative ABC transport system ATP-binding protein